ncbi:MAG: hemolysin family protein [Acidimicrobiales bacterium]
MGTATTLLVVTIGWLVLAAGFLALAETSLTRISRVKAQAMVEEGQRGAARLARLVEHPEQFLNPILLMVLACHLVAATLVGVLAERSFGPVGVAVATAAEVVVIFVLAEAAPKTWAVQHPERAALFSAPLVAAVVNIWPIRLLARLLIGLSNVILPGKGLRKGPYVSEEEILALADAAAEEEVIEHEERALIRSIIEFGDTVAREVMVPRPDMVAVEGRDKVGDVLSAAIAAGLSRIPVYEQGVDDIAGIVFTKDLMRAVQEHRDDEAVRALGREARYVPETKRVAELMKEMQRDKFHMAIVIDEYGGTAGLVTLEDLIEELVGEIVDEFDVEEPRIEALAGGDYRVSARMAVDEVNELLSASLPEGDWDSVGGLVFNLAGHVPTEGEAVDVSGFRLVAEKVQGRRIGRVRISRIAEPEAG